MPEQIPRRPSPPAAALFATIFLVLAGFALSLDLPKTKLGFQGDEATYYSLGHSLARDLDFAFERRDLVRVWDEFPGPEGIFLKQGKTIDLQRTGTFPYLRLVRTPDPRPDRLYYGKSYIYPLIAAPFVRVFGTSGFLVLHAVLMTLNILAAYTFLRARRSSAGTALAYAVVFFGASIVPVYFVSLSPELLNLSLVLYAFCLWSLKETAAEGAAGGAWLHGSRADYLAAALLGVATFSKPSHALLLFPLVFVPGRRREWRRAAMVAGVFALTAGGLFVGNAVITGELNYQGGYRKSFYSHTGFPFANERERFDNIGIGLATDTVRVDIIATSQAPRVFLYNLFYFAAGRYSGLLPYFFPGVVSILLFLARPRERREWQWVVGATAFGAAAGLLLYMPYTVLRCGRLDRQPLLHELLSAVPVPDPAAVVCPRAARGDRRWRPVHRQDGAHAVPHRVLSERPCAVRPVARAARGADARQRSDGHGRGAARADAARRCAGRLPRTSWMPTPSIPKAPPSGSRVGRARISSCVHRPARALAAAPRRCALPLWTSTS